MKYKAVIHKGQEENEVVVLLNHDPKWKNLQLDVEIPNIEGLFEVRSIEVLDDETRYNVHHMPTVRRWYLRDGYDWYLYDEGATRFGTNVEEAIVLTEAKALEIRRAYAAENPTVAKLKLSEVPED